MRWLVYELSVFILLPLAMASICLLLIGRFLPQSGQIAFTLRRGESAFLYLLDVGSGVRAWLMRLEKPDGGFAWSPDGRQLAYLFSGDVYVVDAHCESLDGGCRANTHNITRTAEYRDWFALWSPDGKRMLFHSDRAGGQAHTTIKPKSK